MVLETRREVYLDQLIFPGKPTGTLLVFAFEATKIAKSTQQPASQEETTAAAPADSH